MDKIENRRCPHFDTNDGVCGCPEFWRPAQRSQYSQSSSALPYSQSASNRQISSRVNSIPLPERKESLLVTPAPPGPPKETCFFWYHGSCRRGDDCERPHEAHTTWPIPPPPGFRHFQPCTLPLCPLRSDIAVSDKPQEYQRRRRTMGGQMDGAAFSRARTAGESSSDNDSNTDTDTDINDTFKMMYEIPEDRRNIASRGSTSSGDMEGVIQTDEVKAQKMGRSSSDEIDYFDLSQLLSPPSTPIVNREALQSISHPGTLSKRRPSLTTRSFGRNNDCKLEEASSSELENTVSILERPRKMSQWDIKPPSFGFDGQRSEPAASHIALLHELPPHPSTQFPHITRRCADYMPPPFDTPEAPRNLGTLPQICFSYYHTGYCTLNNGGKCNYLHDMHTPQQTVSLPYSIDNHDPACSLLLCPVRLGTTNQVKHQDNSVASDFQPMIKRESPTPSRMDRSPSISRVGSSPRDLVMAVRGRPPRGMLGQPLPQLTGLARERFKEQKHRMEQIQAKSGIGLEEAASTIEAIHRRKREKQARRQMRRAKKRELASMAEELRLLKEDRESCQKSFDNHTDAWTSQQPLRASFYTENTPMPAVTAPVDVSEGNRRQHKQNETRYQNFEELWIRESGANGDMHGPTINNHVQTKTRWALPGFSKFSSLQQALGQPYSHVDDKVSNGGAYESVKPQHRDSDRLPPLATSSPWKPLQQVVPYEYPQKSLGWTSEERRAEIIREQTKRREVHGCSPPTEVEEGAFAGEGMSRLAAKATTPEVQHGMMGRRMRCQRCLTMKRKCDRGRPCSQCIDAGIDPQDCVDRDASHDMDEQWHNDNGRAQSVVDCQLPGDVQRLDWDTDLVRRLFGEVEY